MPRPFLTYYDTVILKVALSEEMYGVKINVMNNLLAAFCLRLTRTFGLKRKFCSTMERLFGAQPRNYIKQNLVQQRSNNCQDLNGA